MTKEKIGVHVLSVEKAVEDLIIALTQVTDKNGVPAYIDGWVVNGKPITEMLKRLPALAQEVVESEPEAYALRSNGAEVIE